MNIKKIRITIFLFISINFVTFAQPLHDQKWILGAVNGNLFNFENDSLSFSSFDKELRQGEGVATMCNKEGNMIFYSNGCRIANAVHEIMENGEGLNVGTTLDFFCGSNSQGHPIPQSIVALPYPNHPDQYFLIYQDLEAGLLIGNPPQSSAKPLHLQFARIDMSANSGLGIVSEKNEVIITDTLSAGFLQAVRHGNGRDWWIICPRAVSNCYYIILLSPQGFEIIDYQCLGNEWDDDDLAGQAKFSKSGERYIRSHSDNGLNVFDFDRCEGLLSNPTFTSLLPDTSVACNGMAISPNGRFVYTTIFHKVYQFDLEATDITASKVLVAEWDGFTNPNQTDFCLAELAPDNKIYISSFNSTYNLHVINEPDSLGLLCNLTQHALTVENVLFPGFPNHPNYALGFKNPCDTILLAPPSASIYCYPDSIDSFTYQFTDISSNHPTTWLWDFDDNSSSTEKNPFHVFPSNGTYEVCLTVSNDAGTDSICKTIVIQVTGLEGIRNDNLSIFPNPVQTMLYFKHSGIDRWNRIELIDVTGRVLKQVENQSELSIKEFSDGVYFVRVESSLGLHYVRKVVKIKNK